MKRKIIVLGLVLVSIIALFTACGKKDAQSDKVYEFNVNFTFAEDNAPGAVEAIKNCEERSGGRLKLTPYWGNTLLNIMELPKGYADGIAEIGLIPMSIYSDVLPLNSILNSQPFLGFKDKQQAWDIFNLLHEEFPEMDKELLDLGLTPIAYYPMAPYYLHLTYDSPEVRVPSDLRGEKIITNKIEISSFLSDMSAAPVNQPITEYYSSLEKGVAGALWNNYAIINGMGLTPLLHQHVNFGPTGSHLDFNVYIVRTETLNELPEDLQQIILEEWTKAAIAQAAMEQEVADRMYAAGQAQGDLFVDLTPDEIRQWSEPLQIINEAQIAEMAAGNPVARDIADRIRELAG